MAYTLVLRLNSTAGTNTLFSFSSYKTAPALCASSAAA
jgi:hypothetical protein